MDAKTFGAYLKSLRLEKKMTMNKLSLLSGISTAHISNMEKGVRGIPKPETLKRISDALRVNYETMMIEAGYSRGDDAAVVELAKTLNEVVKTSKQIDMNEYKNYTFIVNGETVPPELVEMMLNQIAYILSQRKET